MEQSQLIKTRQVTLTWNESTWKDQPLKACRGANVFFIFFCLGRPKLKFNGPNQAPYVLHSCDLSFHCLTEGKIQTNPKNNNDNQSFFIFFPSCLSSVVLELQVPLSD